LDCGLLVCADKTKMKNLPNPSLRKRGVIGDTKEGGWREDGSNGEL